MKGQRYMKREKFARARQMRARPTPAEEMLWNAIRGRQLAGLKFRQQHPIFGFIADFYCCSARLAVEVDGEIHEGQRGYDERRDEQLADHGITTIRFTNAEVESDLAWVLESIAGAVPLPEAA